MAGMEKKQGFFSAFHDGVARSLTPGRQFAATPRWKRSTEAPDPDGEEISVWKRVGPGIGPWVLERLTQNPSVTVHEAGFPNNRSDLRVLLGVMGAPLAPVPVSAAAVPLPTPLSIKDSSIGSLSAQYILQQYMAATGGQHVQARVINAYTKGKLKMVTSEFETKLRVVMNRNAARDVKSGGFVTWQMNPDMWYVEVEVGGTKVHAGCDGKIVWRHAPWLGTHTTMGPVRPLRRALQGLDPRTTATMFSNSVCIGEQSVHGEDCFVLKVSADPETLKARSEAQVEIVRHVMFGYFSQKSGLLVCIDDSHLTRVQSHNGETVYWETTISSCMDDYFPVEGILIAHSGSSWVTLFRFEDISMRRMKTRMKEVWTIDDVVFNVPGLSTDCFVPPAKLRTGDSTM